MPSRPAKQCKVWGGLTNTAHTRTANGSRQARTIVCARSQRRAVELLSCMSLHEFREYWSETGNANEINITGGEEGVWVNQGDWDNPKWEREK